MTSKSLDHVYYIYNFGVESSMYMCLLLLQVDTRNCQLCPENCEVQHKYQCTNFSSSSSSIYNFLGTWFKLGVLEILDSESVFTIPAEDVTSGTLVV